MRALPLEGHAHMLGISIAYFETSIDSGSERSKKEFKKGDIAFLPSSGSICFFILDAEPGKVMTPIGKIIDDVQPICEIKSGDVFCLYEEAI